MCISAEYVWTYFWSIIRRYGELGMQMLMHRNEHLATQSKMAIGIDVRPGHFACSSSRSVDFARSYKWLYRVRVNGLSKPHLKEDEQYSHIRNIHIISSTRYDFRLSNDRKHRASQLLLRIDLYNRQV